MPLKKSHQPLTFPAVELRELGKPHVVADPHADFTERYERNYKEDALNDRPAAGKTKKKKTGVRDLRVSNTDKLLPGLSVSDSWNRIFPGTSMSKR